MRRASALPRDYPVPGKRCQGAARAATLDVTEGHAYSCTVVGALFFIVVTVVYLAYATRGPAYAMAATAALMPFNQYVPSGFLPGVNIASIALALALWSISQSAKNEKLSFPKVLPLFGVVLTLGYVHSMFAELPPHYAYLYDSWFVFISEIVLFGMSSRFGTKYCFEISDSGRYIGSLMSG